MENRAKNGIFHLPNDVYQFEDKLLFILVYSAKHPPQGELFGTSLANKWIHRLPILNGAATGGVISGDTPRTF